MKNLLIVLAFLVGCGTEDPCDQGIGDSCEEQKDPLDDYVLFCNPCDKDPVSGLWQNPIYTGECYVCEPCEMRAGPNACRFTRVCSADEQSGLLCQ